MIYAIIGILFVVALFLIFRNDHDSSYNRNEKKAQRQSEGARLIAEIKVIIPVSKEFVREEIEADGEPS